MAIKDIASVVGQESVVQGWVNNKRSSGSIAFLELRDGTGFIQAVVAKDSVSADVWGAVEQLTQESSVRVTGMVTKHPKLEQTYELQVSGLEIVSISEEYPIAKKEHGPEFLLENRHLWLRSKRQWAILRIRDTVETAINDYLHTQYFIRVDSPIFTPNACEGT
ncbi:MAG TPA: OB-fold nucleic acid binding domain-containing protein, partial [Candidatus Kapabacteria bacterium]|nr:OB-fold nucleic acid binding domain-containing protein [Candidatus Kapabacteria bacterium]